MSPVGSKSSTFRWIESCGQLRRSNVDRPLGRSTTSRRSPAPSAPGGRRRRTTSARNASASSVHRHRRCRRGRAPCPPAPGRISVLMCSRVSGSKVKIWLRLSSGVLIGEERVLRRRPDQDDDAVLHVRQQHVLLGLVEAVDLVEEQDRPLAVRLPGAARASASSSRTSLVPAATALSGLNRLLVWLAMTWARAVLPRAGRAVEDQRAEPVGEEHPAEQLAGAEEVLLADELVEGPRPHPGGQRPGLVPVGRAHLVEQVHAKPPGRSESIIPRGR